MSKSCKNSGPQSQWIGLIKESVFESSSEDYKPVICKLKHPRSGESSMYVFSNDDTEIFELLRFDEDCRSWFIDETVQQDGSLYMTTAVNPVYLALPYLITAAKCGKFQLMDQILQDEDYPELRRLPSCLKQNVLEKVTESKGDTFKAYKYNEESTMTWLKTKVEKLSLKLKEKQVNVSGDHQASSVICNPADDEYLHFAHGMVSDYLPVELSERLREYMGIKAMVHDKPQIDEPAAKRSKTGDVKPLEDYSQSKREGNVSKNGNLTQAQKKLEKVDKKGMKNISSFFSPKPAKVKK